MDKREFSLLDLLQLLKIRWWIVFLAALFVAAGVGVYSYFSYEPTYSSEIQVYVSVQNSDQGSAGEDVSQVNWALRVLKTYVELLKTDDFFEQVSDIYKGRFPAAWEEQPYTALRLAGCTEFMTSEDTFTFTVRITTNNKEASYNLCKIFEELAPQQIKNLTGRDAIKISDGAELAVKEANSRNMRRNIMLGFLIGAALAFVIIVIVDVCDVRIKTEEDIVDKYPYPLLGSVPNFENARKRGYGYYGKSKK